MLDTCFVICNLAMLKLKPPFSFRQKRGGVIGGDVYYEYVLLPLVNKEADFVQWLKRVKSG